jgi:hypothetical protein
MAGNLGSMLFYGTGFAIDGVPVPFGSLAATSGELTGTLLSGEPLDVVILFRAPTATITLVQAPECLDGIDNDGDGAIDLSGDLPDPGCSLVQTAKEAPACSDGIDNDGDGAIDFAADTLCQGAWDDDEASDPLPTKCGLLGIEPLVVLAYLHARRRRSGARSSRQTARAERTMHTSRDRL